MKILFSVGELESNLTATSKIAVEMADLLSRMGHSCRVCGMCHTSRGDETTASGVKLKRLHSSSFIVKSSDAFENYIKTSGLDRNRARSRFIKKHPLYSVGLFLKYNRKYTEKRENPLFINKFTDYVKEFRPDAVIAVCKPIRSYELVLTSDIPAAKYAWQMDPWGLHRLDNPENSSRIIEKEIAAFSRAEHIFTTPVLLSQYSGHDMYRPLLGKMTAVDFPNVKPLHTDAESAIDFDPRYTNILFSGIVADEFRSPERFLESLSGLFEKGEKVRVYFMGTNNSPSLGSYMEKYPENVFFRNQVSLPQAFATMKQADILLNISNAIDNQVPSKIFDYFATGKPVINIQKTNNCPARVYFDRYPLAITFEDFSSAEYSPEDFIKETAGKNLNFEQVKDIFTSATPEYVADQILHILTQNKEI